MIDCRMFHLALFALNIAFGVILYFAVRAERPKRPKGSGPGPKYNRKPWAH